MKHFKTISALFIMAIVVIFGFNIYYLVNLYGSIRSSVERDVMTAMADADIDDMWERADRVNRAAEAARRKCRENGDSVKDLNGQISGVKDKSGNFVTTTRTVDGDSSVNETPLRRDRSYTNQMVDDMSRQMHASMDRYVDYNLTIMDSILARRLADRRIYPEYLAVEIVNSKGKIVRDNPHILKDRTGFDEFSLCFNPEAGLYYHAYMTPLTRHIISEMSGVIVTIFMLMAVFSLAFIYLFRTVSRLRTIEEMKDDFVSNMTHELKTPIAIAYSANDALLNYDSDSDRAKRKQYLTIANRQLKRLGNLVENILAMSMERRRAMRLRPEPVQLLPFAEEIAAAHMMRNDKNITIEVDVDSSAIVEADRSHLANILNNLIDNAIKYSGESVSIEIEGYEDSISVSDDGIGIPMKSIPYLFDKFYRVPHGNRQDVRGFGIGLYYVKNILDRMGWSISVKSKESVGSTFTIKFYKNAK